MKLKFSACVVITSLSFFSPRSGLAQNSVINAFGPVFGQNINAGGFNATVNSQLSFGNFFGLGNEWLYQYQVIDNVNAGGGNNPIQGYNLFSGPAGNPGAIAAAQAGLWGATAAGGAVGGANPIAAAGGAANNVINGIPFQNNLALPNNGGLIAALSFNGGALVYTFPGLNNGINLNANINTATPANTPNPAGGAALPTDWEISIWADAAGDTLVHWFDANGNGLQTAGASVTFDIFSPYGPVPGNNFVDPGSSSELGVDDLGGDQQFDGDAYPTQDVPEPNASVLGIFGILALAVVRRNLRKPAA